MSIDFRVIWAADVNNAIRLDVRRPARRPKVTRRPLSAVTTKFKEDDRYIVMGIDFRVIWVVDFNNTTIFYVRLPTRRPRVTHRPPSH